MDNPSDRDRSADGPLERDAVEPNADQRRVIESDRELVSVDAGAGTGKTTTMLLRIERAIERGDVDPENVLVLTFANEAASSIREAVSRRLDPEAAAAIDVYTYHSLCYRLVREYAYYLGLAPDFDVITERKRRRIVARLLAENEYDFAAASARGDGSPADLAAEIDSFIASMSREDIDPETLETRLPSVRALELCAEFVLWLEDTASTELSFDNEALRYFNDPDHLDAAREALVEYGKLVEFCREKIAEAPEQFRSEPVVRSLARYLTVVQQCVTNTIERLDLGEPTTKHLPRVLFGNSIYGTGTSRIEQTPFGRLKHYVEFLRLARHYTDVYADYRQRLEREHAVDFDELVRTATGLLAASDTVEHERRESNEVDVGDEVAGRDEPDERTDRLTDDRIADEITAQWDHVYCDEFQDTDETQYQLVDALTAGPDRPDLLAIGDKDQAIYGWRGTDRKGLDRLGTDRAESESIELEVNFRSRQEILDLTNHCSYGPQSSKTLREDGRTQGAYDEPKPPHRVLKVESDELTESTPEQVATTVSRLLNGSFENVPRRSLSDIAVIVRTNRHAQAIAEELQSLRIPYEVSGSQRGEISPGIRTLLSYLRVLVAPDADRHLRRVLLYRYRVPEPVLETLTRRDGTLYDSLFDIDFETESISAADRLSRARDHLQTLESIRSAYPLSEFVRRFREITSVEWYLTDSERAELDRIDRFVEGYGGDSILSTLTVEFVDALERMLRGNDSSYGRGSHSEDCVNVMTVHQAKGLEFDTVLVPYLSDEEWCVDADYAKRERHRLLTATLESDIESPLLADLASEPLGEEWRVFHVALTRAENHLFVFGSDYEYDGDETELSVSIADDCLAEEIRWSVAGKRMDLWSTVTESFETVREAYPETVVDCTDAIEHAAETHPGSITYYSGYDDRRIEPLETEQAVETVSRLGRLLRSGTLLPAADAGDVVRDPESVPRHRHASALTTETTRFPVETLSAVSDLEATIRHSYSALETHKICTRKHYLDHVVRAPVDPMVDRATDRTGSVTGGRQNGSVRRSRSDRRLVGSIFHAVAEEAFYRGYDTRSRWREAAVRQLTARNKLEHRETLLSCIDRYFQAQAPDFETPIAEWRTLGAELPFVLEDVSEITGEVVGYVDAVKRTPAGELVVVDYKATAERIAPKNAVQLSLYRRACEDLFDEPVRAAGYVYVGDLEGPRVTLYESEELPEWASVRDTLESADTPEFLETTPGPHCQSCPHRSLGCGPDEYAIDDR